MYWIHAVLVLQKFVQDGYILLLLDYTNQGHLTKFRTNLMEKIVNVYSSFSTNYPCIQAVYHTGNRFLVILDNFWKTIVNFNDFYLLNLWKILLGGLGQSSRTVTFLWLHSSLNKSIKIIKISSNLCETIKTNKTKLVERSSIQTPKLTIEKRIFTHSKWWLRVSVTSISYVRRNVG